MSIRIAYFSILFLLIACNVTKKENPSTDKSLLDNTWQLYSVKGEQVLLRDFTKEPFLQFNVENKLISGNDGCNSLSGSLVELDHKKLSFSPLASTRMACFKMAEMSNTIKLALNDVQSYEIQDEKLTLFDAQGNEVLTYELMQNNTRELVIWVNAYKQDCVGIGPMKCLQIQKNETINPNDWKLLYDKIEGFEFEQGYVYKLKVKELERSAKDTPADASTISYELISILDKMIENKTRLHDIWALSSIKGAEIDAEKMRKHPQLEINLTQNSIMGNDGCNNFRGGIEMVNDTKLSFTPLASTKMACPGIIESVGGLLGKVDSYKIEKLHLYLYDENGHELLKYKKVD